MKKRSLIFIVLILAAIIVTGLFIGCKKGSAGSGTVIFYLWEDPAYKSIIDAFNSSQDKVFVALD